MFQSFPLLLKLVIADGNPGRDGTEAEPTSCQTTNEQQLQQVALAVDRVAPLSTGLIDQPFGGVEAHGARRERFSQQISCASKELVEAVSVMKKAHTVMLDTCTATVKDVVWPHRLHH